MVECPICKSMCFDDMEVCYGCMHRFDRGYAFSDGLTSSGLPDFEVEEPKAVAVQPRSAAVPASFTFPVDAQGYNLVISVQPVKKSDEDIWRADVLKAAPARVVEEQSSDATQPLPAFENPKGAESLSDDGAELEAMALDELLEKSVRDLAYA